MLDKIKSFNKMARLNSQLSKQLEQIFVKLEKRGRTVVIRGDKKIEKIEIDGEEQKDLKELINDAFKELEKKLSKNKELEGQIREQLDKMGLKGL